ncbi:MAG: hypothetical protein Kow0056_12480 [Coriobacteriia bacterium]
MDEKTQDAGNVEPEAQATDTGAETTGKPKWPLVIVAIFVVAVLGTVAAVACNTLSARLAARADLERALELVREADDTVLAVDDIVFSEITPALAGAAREASEQVPAAREDIVEAVELIEGSYSDLDEEDRAVADALRTSADSRLAMLNEAPLLLSVNASAAVALDHAQDAMDAMLAAEELADKAVDKYNLQTKEGVTASKELLNQATEKLDEAKKGFKAAEEAFPEADMGPFIRYINAKKDLVKKSIRIDDLWLAGDLAEANDLVDEYNKQDKEVADLGEKLPESEVVPIREAYDDLTSEALDRYLAARDAAARSDTLLRELLGEEPAGQEATSTSQGQESTVTPSQEETGASSQKETGDE